MSDSHKPVFSYFKACSLGCFLKYINTLAFSLLYAFSLTIFINI